MIALALACLVQAPAETLEPVQREWEIRRRALHLEESRAELLSDLDGPNGVEWSGWPRRHAAAEALRRGIPVADDALGSWIPDALLRGVRDVHPNVRATALAALAHLGEAAELPPDDAERLAVDSLPAVRAALAGALARVRCSRALAVLRALVDDADPTVAETAWSAFIVRAAGAPELAELLQRAYAEERDDELLEALRLVRRAPFARPAQEAATGGGAAGSQSQGGGGGGGVLGLLSASLDGLDDDRARAWRAVLEALVFERGGTGRVDVLIDGWLGPDAWDPRRQELLLGAGRGGDAALGEALLAALAEVDRIAGGSGGGSGRWPRFAEDVRRRLDARCDVEVLHLRFDLLDAAEACLGAEAIAAALVAGAFPRATEAFLLPELGLRVERWDAERAAVWLDADRPRGVRLAAAEGFANTLSVRGDAGAQSLLTAALADPDPIVVRVAFRTLCDSAVSPPYAELHRAWRAGDADERRERLAWLPRDRTPTDFRVDLLALGAGEAERGLAVELLATFRGDEEVERVLSAWLAADLAALVAREGDDARAAEQRVMGEVRALAAVTSGAARVHDALERSLGVSADVGKTAAAAMAPRYAADLYPYLAPSVDRRTRIEAAIGIARYGGGEELRAAVATLRGDFDHAAWDLRVRMLDALGAAGTAEARAFLERVALAGGYEPEDRVRSLEALARLGGAAELLARAARETPDFEARLAAVGLLGSDPTPTAGEALLALYDDGPVGLVTEDERRLLRSAVRTALAESGRLPVEREGDVLSAPLARAAETLARRFRGEDPPNPGFAWRGELRQSAALAERGRLDDALAATGDWWRLDAALLFKLADAALEAEDTETARALYRAALVAGEGDPRARAGRGATARFRLLGLCWHAERWPAAQRLAAGILADWRARRLSPAAWEEAFGVFDRRGGVDPRARIESAVLQAEAWAALGRGDGADARDRADAAAAAVGISSGARAEQRRLEAALGDR